MDTTAYGLPQLEYLPKILIRIIKRKTDQHPQHYHPEIVPVDNGDQRKVDVQDEPQQLKDASLKPYRMVLPDVMQQRERKVPKQPRDHRRKPIAREIHPDTGKSQYIGTRRNQRQHHKQQQHVHVQHLFVRQRIKRKDTDHQHQVHDQV